MKRPSAEAITACVVLWMMTWAVACGVAPTPSLAAAACPETGDASAVVVAVGPRFDVRLADGRVLRAVGIDPVADTPTRPDFAETGRQGIETLISGRPLSVHVLEARPDRWGRLPAFVFVEADAGTPTNLAVAAVGAGLARYLAEPAAHACREPLLAAERAARAAKTGLWADPYYSVLGVDDRSAFAERSATVVVAEVTLTKVEAGPYRTKLRFAARGRWDRDTLAASILPRIVKLFEEQGVKVQSLVGRNLRVRGLLDLRFGPQIELTSPDALEVLSPEAEPQPPRPAASAVGHG